MTINVKHSGQLAHIPGITGSGLAFATRTKLAVCGCAAGTNPTTVYPYAVPVTVRRRRIAVPATV